MSLRVQIVYEGGAVAGEFSSINAALPLARTLHGIEHETVALVAWDDERMVDFMVWFGDPQARADDVQEWLRQRAHARF